MILDPSRSRDDAGASDEDLPPWLQQRDDSDKDEDASLRPPPKRGRRDARSIDPTSQTRQGTTLNAPKEVIEIPDSDDDDDDTVSMPPPTVPC